MTVEMSKDEWPAARYGNLKYHIVRLMFSRRLFLFTTDKNGSEENKSGRWSH